MGGVKRFVRVDICLAGWGICICGLAGASVDFLQDSLVYGLKPAIITGGPGNVDFGEWSGARTDKISDRNKYF